MTNVVTQSPRSRFLDNNGNPIPLGQVFVYQPVTTTKITSYQDQSNSNPNTNPIQLDFRSECDLWLPPGTSYKLVLAMPGDTDPPTNPIWTRDNLTSDQLGVLTLTAAQVGAALYPQTAAETAASITPTNYAYPPYDLRRYGADPTGVAASDTALSNAIAVCGTTGGTIRLPAGKYTFANLITALANKTSIILQGDGSNTGGVQPATQIAYSGTAAGPFIDLRSSVGCKLRDLQIVHTNAGFTGTYMKFGNDGSHGDGPFCELSNCVVGSSVGGVGNLHVDLDKCICFTAYNCNFIYGNPSVRGQATAGGSYSNVIRFRDCHWATSYVAPVQNGGQAWEFDGCTFEPLVTANTPAGALLSQNVNCFFNALKMTGCWFGDAGTGVGTWLDIFTQGFEFSGNYVSGNTTGTTAMTLRSSFGVHIVGNIFNSFLNGINVVTTGNDWVFKANVAATVTNPWVGGNNIPTGGIDFGPNFGFGIPGTIHGVQATNGFSVHPDGTIEQWGLVNPASFGTHAITPFLIPFASACYNVTLTLNGVAATTATIYASALTTTGFTYFLTDGVSTTDSFYWRAIGK